MAKIARLTTTRHGVYALRWVVPKQLRGTSGRPREVRLSLRTRDLNRARILVARFNLEMDILKIMGQPPHDPRSGPDRFTLTAGGLKVDIHTDEDRQIFQDLLRHDQSLHDAFLKAITSAGSTPTSPVAAFLPPPPAGSTHGARSPIRLKDAIELYANTRDSLDRNRRSTASEKRRTMELLRDDLVSKGYDIEALFVHEIGRPLLIGFVTAYANRPGKAAASKATEPGDDAGGGNGNENASGIESAGNEGGLSSRTVVKAVGHLSNFFVYARAQEWVAQNPIDDDFLKAIGGLRKEASQDRRTNTYAMFTQAELPKIFQPSIYLRALSAADDFWAPIVALYTGARLGEVVQLEVDSIKFDELEGLYLIAFKKLVDGRQAAKTSNSVRKVPVPNALVDLGFIKYVEHVRNELKESRLFPHRAMNSTRVQDPSKHVSRVFNDYLDKVVGIDDPTKVTHSLRHTVVTHLHAKGVPVGDAELICGHAAQDAHARLAAAQPGGGSSQTHLQTYAHTAQYSTAATSLYQRLKLHMDNALVFDLDMKGLGAAAQIVLENTRRRTDGTVESGWNTNNRKREKEIAERLAKASSPPGSHVVGSTQCGDTAA